MSNVISIMQRGPVIPVVTVPDDGDIVALGRALLAGGISVVEITLRTPAAMSAIRTLADAMPDCCVGAGTVWTDAQAEAVIDAGAEFIVTPGISMPVHDVAVRRGVPLLPGAQTTSEVAHWQAHGLDAVKFFPAEVAGGVAALKAFSAVFPDMQFCPTGGVSANNAADYLGVPAVTCVGGSWLVPGDAFAAGDWDRISALATAASAL